LWVIAGGIAQAAFAAKTPEGMGAGGPSIRSANTDSMIACRRWVMSASVTGSVLLVKNGWYRHTGNTSSGWLRSRTRRTMSRAVISYVVPANAVWSTSATSASEINSPVSGSRDGAGVAHRGPRVVGDGADRAEHRSGLGQHEGEPGAAVHRRGDDLAVAERGVTPARDVLRAGGRRGVDGFA
jgi:hypothetical protein